MDEKKMKNVRVRIAPSPTGFLHIGLARAALFNYLIAKKYEGDFVLRIEDTDLERSKPEYEKDIIDNLKWLGIEWTEGPDIGGKYGPYRQTERIDLYEKYLKKLLDEGKAYYCFCSEEELEAQRQYMMSQGEAPKYSGKCSNSSKEIVDKNLAEGKPSVIRFRLPSKKVAFKDVLRGKIEFDSRLIGDIVIAKDLKTPLYNFAVVIDDFEMKISHVIRGEDHVSNTPKQILLQEALGFPKTEFGHLPLVVGTDRTKLSKRNATVSVAEYRKEGYLPEALINFMAFLGWNPGDEREIFSLSSLVKEFSSERVQKSPAVFNIKKLDYLNGFYIRNKTPKRLVELCLPYLIKSDLIGQTSSGYIISETGKIVSSEDLEQIIFINKDRLKKLSEISELSECFLKDKLDYDKSLLKWKEMDKEDVSDSLNLLEKIFSEIDEKDFTKEKLEETIMPQAEKTGDRGGVLWPLRVALSGKQNSAGPFEIAAILGKDKVLKRIKEAKNE